jgi:hypothetical protein
LIDELWIVGQAAIAHDLLGSHAKAKVLVPAIAQDVAV